ncbi:MAG: GNAT family acetyltransferase [Gammaproteobacteria bacterium]|nr:GNAT family acetyltransferase [Gammaproteobacteria bacterium]
MEIRQFRDGDESAVVRLWQDCELVVPWNDPQKDIQRKLDAGVELFLVGELEEKLIASVMGGYDGHRGWIYYLAVAPMFRKRGFAQTMMAEIESRLLALGCAKINLMVRNTNTEVIEFYNTLGYALDKSVGMGKRLIADD